MKNIEFAISFLTLLALTTSCSIAKPQKNDSDYLYKFAIIGDFGSDNKFEKAVAKLVKKQNVDFIITLGDNNYDKGEEETIDKNIGKYYQEYIGNYMGKYGKGAKENRFYPTLGNHDWYSPGAKPYLEYFTLPGNERYYDFTKGPIHFIALDSDKNEPDGITTDSKQYKWLEKKLKDSKSKYKLVYFHHPPYSSGKHGDEEDLKWDFKELGADIVICGHDHHYERIEVDGLTYLITGNGGAHLRLADKVVDGSKVRYDKAHGALIAYIYKDKIVYEALSINKKDNIVDSFTHTF